MRSKWASFGLMLVASLSLLPNASGKNEDRVDTAIKQNLDLQRASSDTVEQARRGRIIDALTKVRNPGAGSKSWMQDVITIEGVVQLTSDTVMTANRILFRRGATIVTGGVTLFLNAEVIEVEGEATINGTGTPGTPGGPGASIGGEWHSRGDSDYGKALSECRTQSNHPDRGANGRDGSRGGDGSVVILATAVDPTRLHLLVDGGFGGPGGLGGSGRLYKNGRNYYCDGCTAQCPSGANGNPGERGRNGSVVQLPDMPPPAFAEFDAASKYRIYPDAHVQPGKIRVTVTNEHANDMVRFELWKDTRGSTYNVEVRGSATQVIEINNIALDRLVWVGHQTLQLSRGLDPNQGWSIDFRRENR